MIVNPLYRSKVSDVREGVYETLKRAVDDIERVLAAADPSLVAYVASYGGTQIFRGDVQKAKQDYILGTVPLYGALLSLAPDLAARLKEIQNR